MLDNDSYEGTNARALASIRRLLGVLHLLGDAVRNCFDLVRSPDLLP